MSTNELKRIPVKYIRDYIKKDYKLRDRCFICEKTDSLELHHLYSLSELWNKWCESQGIIIAKITTVEEINDLRVRFEKDNREPLGHENLFTLCKPHHERLHSLYGQRYGNHMAKKVKRWLDIQREKHKGG